MLKTNQQKKQYILRVWSISSGKKIALMLKEYWGLEKKQENIITTAKKLFT